MTRIALALLAAIALAAAWWSWRDDPIAPDARPSTPASSAAHPADSATASASPVGATSVRDEAGGGHSFVSVNDDGRTVTDCARDGITILVLGADRQPRAGAKLRVRWGKDNGDYGEDRGATDESGRFATTVAEPEMLEHVALTDPVHGELYAGDDFLPMANDPRTVLCVVPELHALTVRVVDESGVPIPTAMVATQCARVDEVQREFVLLPEATEVAADSAGRAVLHVAAGAHEVRAKADGHEPMYSLRVEVPRGGRTVTMHLLSARGRHDVAVRVITPPELPGLAEVTGFTSEVPALPGLEPEALEPVQMRLVGRRVTPREFVVSAPPMPWTCLASVQGIESGAPVDALATAVTIELHAPVAKPVVKLRIKLLLPNGEPTSGEVAVHVAPDLVHGQVRVVDPSSPFVMVEPGGRACISAGRRGYPPAVVGPIELVVGEQDVVLQLEEPRSIRGRVVDEHGNPARASLFLRRPAGVLRSLGTSVPMILADSANLDNVGTSVDGGFCFETLGAGEHAVYAHPDGVGWPGYVRVQPGDQNVVVRLGDGVDDLVRIEGRVTLSTTGATVAGASVRWCADGEWRDCCTDTEGRYRVTIPPGRLHATVFARRCAYFESDPAPFANGLHVLDLVVTPCEPLFIRVVDEAGRVPRLDVRAFDGKGREITFVDHRGNDDGKAVRLDSNGRAELGGVPNAAVRLRLQTESEDDAMDVDVPATFRRDADFPITWKPQPKPPDNPK